MQVLYNIFNTIIIQNSQHTDKISKVSMNIQPIYVAMQCYADTIVHIEFNKLKLVKLVIRTSYYTYF